MSEPATEPNTGPATEEGKPAEKTLTQSQVNEIVASRTREAKESALKDLAKDLGVSVDEAKRIVKERQEAEERNATELDRANKAKAAAEAERDEKVTAASRELHAERTDRALIAAGIADDDEKLGRIRGMLTVEVGASKEDIKADVEKLKKDFPALFGAEGSTKPPTAPGSDPKTTPGKQAKVTEGGIAAGLARAQKEAEARQAQTGIPIPGLPA
ncbi:MAG TPA: hypothetical protein VNN79_15405, partial [Actinomycetota bacterium]|nr:hypothetical protein [Actinomycetota bacterium]